MAETTSKATTTKASAKAAAKKPVPETEVGTVASKKESVTKKPAAKKTVASTEGKTTATAKKPAAPKKTTATTKRSSASKLPAMSDEQRYRMVAEAAYYRAESHQFRSDPLRDWIEAEKDIAALLSVKK